MPLMPGMFIGAAGATGVVGTFGAGAPGTVGGFGA